jgi:hypothetical protein
VLGNIKNHPHSFLVLSLPRIGVLNIYLLIVLKPFFMKTYTFMASAKEFNNAEPDTRGLMPVVLIPLTGHAPRPLNVISGTSALLQGIEVGDCYAIRATEIEPTDEGYEPVISKKTGEEIRQFNFQSLAKVDTFKAVEASVSKPATFVIKSAEQISLYTLAISS